MIRKTKNMGSNFIALLLCSMLFINENNSTPFCAPSYDIYLSVTPKKEKPIEVWDHLSANNDAQFDSVVQKREFISLYLENAVEKKIHHSVSVSRIQKKSKGISKEPMQSMMLYVLIQPTNEDSISTTENAMEHTTAWYVLTCLGWAAAAGVSFWAIILLKWRRHHAEAYNLMIIYIKSLLFPLILRKLTSL